MVPVDLGSKREEWGQAQGYTPYSNPVRITGRRMGVHWAKRRA